MSNPDDGNSRDDDAQVLTAPRQLLWSYPSAATVAATAAASKGR